MLTLTTVSSFDGLELDVYTSAVDEQPAIVLVNAFGISARIAVPLAQVARQHGLGLVTWEARGAPGRFHEQHSRYLPGDHARDLLAILQNLGVGPVTVVGWCSGGEIALHAAARSPEAFQRLILVSPYLSFTRQSVTPVGTNLAEMIGAVSENVSRASMFYQIVRRSGRDAAGLGLTEDPEMLELVSAPFERGPDYLYRYAAALASLYNNALESWCEAVRVPTLAIGGARDRVSHPDDVARLGERIPSVTPRVFADADHYSLFRHEGLQHLVCLHAKAGDTDATDLNRGNHAQSTSQ